MGPQTTPSQRERFFLDHQAGMSYQVIADRFDVSKECVRYWCRCLRDGGSPKTTYHRPTPGPLSCFHPLIRYAVLRMRLEHPRWGPRRTRFHLGQCATLSGLRLPSASSIGRYLHQWERFRRQPKKKPEPRRRPDAPTRVHQCWQIDFKVGIALDDGTQVNLHTVYDPIGEVCIAACVTPAGPAGKPPRSVTLPEVQTTLRSAFVRWGTLPEQIQTDGAGIFVGKPTDSYPSKFSLWLAGLGLCHRVTRPGKPTDNAGVERCHRTVCDYAIRGNEHLPAAQLQRVLEAGVTNLAFHLPSHAAGCNGLPPVVAHPDLLKPLRPYRVDHEHALFDLKRVDAYLGQFTWQRKVGKTGQITLGGRHCSYSVGRNHARRHVWVQFDPTDRNYVFFADGELEQDLGRQPARGLDVPDLTGLLTDGSDCVPQQLPLALPLSEGVTFK